jgi:hypothetical protein
MGMSLAVLVHALPDILREISASATGTEDTKRVKKESIRRRILF